MTDGTHEIARARDALRGAAAVPDRQVLGAVRTGLLLVPAEPMGASVPPQSGGSRADGRQDGALQLAVRRRSAG